MKRNKLFKCVALTVAFSILSFAAMSQAPVPFTAGNIVVYRTGNGVDHISSFKFVPVYLDEYTPSGTLVQSIAMPVIGGAGDTTYKLTESITAQTGGGMTLSSSGQYLVLPGYNVTPGLTSATGLAKVIGVVKYDGTINTRTGLTDFTSNTLRSVASDDGTRFWIGGTKGSNQNVNYVSGIGATTSTAIVSVAPATYQVSIFDGQLYASCAANSSFLIFLGAVGSGLPTTGGQTIGTISGATANTGAHIFQYIILDLNPGIPGPDVMYLAHTGTAFTTNSGGIQKWSLVGGSWVLNSVVGTNADTYRGLTAKVSGTTVTLYGTRAGNNNSSLQGAELISITDNTGYNGAFSGTPFIIANLVTRFGANDVASFHGVALVPQPPPPCPSPSLPVISNITPNSALINWNAVGGAVGYDYAVSTNANPPISGTITTNTNYSASGLTQGLTYYAHVRTYCGPFNYSSWVTTSFIPTCTAPANPIVTNIGRTADISWSPSAGAIGYEYAITTNAMPPTGGSSIAGTSLTATNLEAVTQYYLHVRTNCGAGGFSTWTTVAFKTPCFVPIISSVNSNTKVTEIKWNKVKEGVTYEYAILNIIAPPLGGSLTSDTVYSTSKLLAGNSYYFHVRSSCGANGFSGWTSYLFHVPGLEAYPNPVSGTLTIKLYGIPNSGKIYISDAIGRIVKIVQVSGNSIDVDMRALAAGIYLIKYNDGGNNYILRILKK